MEVLKRISSLLVLSASCVRWDDARSDDDTRTLILCWRGPKAASISVSAKAPRANGSRETQHQKHPTVLCIRENRP